MAHICMVLIGNIRYDGRVRKEIGTLTKAGHQVELIVSDYSKNKSGGEDLGIKIHYLPMKIWPNAVINFWEQIAFNRKAASIIRGIRPTHIHCHDLPSLFSGIWAKRRTKTKLIFDAHELYPESLGGIRENMWGYIEKFSIKHCDHVIMPEKHRIDYFKKKYKNTHEPLLLQNFPRKNDIPIDNFDLFREKYPINENSKIVLYTGFIDPRRYVEELIKSMSFCGEEFVLILLGGSRKNYDEYKGSLYKKINKLDLANRIFIHESVPNTELLKYMASADIGIAFYRNTNINNYYCASNKLYEFIALEKVVLTNNYPGLLEVVERFKQGICLAEVTPESLAESYASVSADHITPGTKKFYWEDEEHILLQLYDK